MISLIAACSSNYVIGKDNKLPWNYPEDLKYFKNMTSGKTIVMWRKTFESIWKPLPNRKNIVLTRNIDRSAPWVTVIHNIQELIEKYQDSGDELMVIWWEQIYTLFLPYASKIYLTEVKKEIEWDAFFPQFSWFFNETSRDIHNEYDFVVFEKKKWLTPKVGIWVAIIKNNKILLGKRIGVHAWWVRSWPWGKLDIWESREMCAEREVFEETWVYIDDIKLLEVTNYIYPKEWNHFVTIWLTAIRKSWEVICKEPEKFEDRERFDFNTLPKPLFKGYPAIIDTYFK